MNELAQELAVHLGLKNRKPYISTKVRRLILFKVFIVTNKTAKISK